MPTPLRGARILAADLSLSCSGICIFDLDSMMPTAGRAFPEPSKDPGWSEHSFIEGVSTYARALRVAHRISAWVVNNVEFGYNFSAMEGPATNSRFRNEETTAIRQAFYGVFCQGRGDHRFVIVPPTSAKLALTGKGNADKMTMVNAALAQTRGTPFFDTLSALVKPGRKHNPEAEAIADAFGVARAAAKILFQRNARESSLLNR